MKCNTLDVRYRSEDYQPAQAQAEGAHHRAGAGPFALDGKPRTQAQCNYSGTPLLARLTVVACRYTC